MNGIIQRAFDSTRRLQMPMPKLRVDPLRLCRFLPPSVPATRRQGRHHRAILFRDRRIFRSVRSLRRAIAFSMVARENFFEFIRSLGLVENMGTSGIPLAMLLSRKGSDGTNRDRAQLPWIIARIPKIQGYWAMVASNQVRRLFGRVEIEPGLGQLQRMMEMGG
jgi:hypothetical protein